MASDNQKTIELNIDGILFSEDDDWQYIKFTSDVSNDVIEKTLKEIYDFENIDNHKNIALDFKEATTEQKIIALRYSMTRKDLHDDYMITNIYNLLKTYNNLKDSYFSSKFVYVNSSSENLSIRKALKEELAEMRTELSWYLLCMLKSYNKTAYTTQDEHVTLPIIYQIMMLGSDFMTLFGIFGVAKPINTESLKYVDNSFMYLNALLTKAGTMGTMLNEYMKELEENGTLIPENED